MVVHFDDLTPEQIKTATEIYDAISEYLEDPRATRTHAICHIAGVIHNTEKAALEAVKETIEEMTNAC